MPEHDPFIPHLSRPLICIVGPTASGKSELAQELALHLDGVVISADSMQVYRGMDIGTGKLPLSRRVVPHFGLDLADPGQSYSVSLFQDYARHVAAEQDARGKRVILCGGTGLYIRSVIDGFAYPQGGTEGEENPVRAEYTELLHQIGEQALWERLREVDPESAAVIHPHNSRRVIRAFELLSNGGSYARQKQNLKRIPQVVPTLQIGIGVDRTALNARIDRRVDAMVEAGLVQEVRGLLQSGFRTALTAPKAIGYREIVAALDGDCSLEQAVEDIKVHTHRYAKRQRSWFRRDARIRWIDGARPGEAPGLSGEEGDAADAVLGGFGVSGFPEWGNSPADNGETPYMASLVRKALAELDTIDAQ